MNWCSDAEPARGHCRIGNQLAYTQLMAALANNVHNLWGGVSTDGDGDSVTTKAALAWAIVFSISLLAANYAQYQVDL